MAGEPVTALVIAIAGRPRNATDLAYPGNAKPSLAREITVARPELPKTTRTAKLQICNRRPTILGAPGSDTCGLS